MELTRMMMMMMLMMSLLMVDTVVGRIDNSRFKGKVQTRKCCLLSEILVEVAPGVRNCTSVEKIGLNNLDLKPRMWRGVSLTDFIINHLEPGTALNCGPGESLFPAYHHELYHGRTENLELMKNGSLMVRLHQTLVKMKILFSQISWGDNDEDGRELSSDKYCVDKLLMSHNYSHINNGDVTHFAYVCLNMEKSVSEIVENIVYPIGNIGLII